MHIKGVKMSIRAIGATPNFKGVYKLNANQQLGKDEKCFQRDALMGYWSARAINGESVERQLKDFYKGEYEENQDKPLNIAFHLPDELDSDFEASMNYVGQNFEKIV